MPQQRRHSIVKDLTISSDEALIIDAAFKSAEGDIFSEYREMLSLVGRCISSNQDITLGLTEQELWDLRARINMAVSVGRTTGADLLRRIYTLILECRAENLFNNLSFDCPVIFQSEAEVKDVRERENEDQNENSPGNNTGAGNAATGRPGPKTES